MDINIDTSPEKEILVFDSSFLVALLYDKDSLHLPAKKLGYEIDNVEMLPDFIISETATVLRNKVSAEFSDNFVKIFTNTQDVEIQFFNTEFRVFCDEFMNLENKNLSFVDASLLALHKTGKYRVVTFDKNLKKLIEKFDKTKSRSKK